MKEKRTKIFISCGQREEEMKYIKEIEDYLVSIGYGVYIAKKQQTLEGLKENIFKELYDSEYFLFVDFKREKLYCDKGEEFRGSLFTNQELAIASFLHMPFIGFREKGIKKLDGISQFIQANMKEFDNRKELINLVKEEIKYFDKDWKNELQAEAITGLDPFLSGTNEQARFFHVKIINRHKDKIARNCYAYLEKIKDINDNRIFDLWSIEIKWSGYVYPNASILPKMQRNFDAFYIKHNNPKTLHFNLFSDSTRSYPRIIKSGKYEFTYLVISDNFRPVRAKFLLELNPILDDTKFTKIDYEVLEEI
jgi:hypothetical protein